MYSAARGGLSLSAANQRSAAAPSAQALEQEAHRALRATFGFDAFRGRQLDAIVAALQGKDSFVLMPTGGGKSLCFSLVPAIRPGVVLVVSPLIALMQDQVQALQARGLRADYLSSTRSEAERRRLLDDLQQPAPQTQLLYVTPELLATDSFLRCLRGAYAAGTLLLCAVDEAHCVSSWGHSFRHTYRRLWVVRQELPRLPLMALTATASERVQRDIVAQLRLRDPLMLRTSFNRPNIRYEVRYLELLRGPQGRPLSTPLPDIALLLEQAAGGAGQQRQSEQQQRRGPGDAQAQRRQLDVPCTVVYCHRRQDADLVAEALRKRGIACAAYHAGLPDARRTQVLEDWQARRLAVVAATVAFGMGIDRSDVRYVIHYSLPQSLEGLYQESGRAGRDGAPSQSIVYFSTEDRQRQEFVLGKGGQRDGKGGGKARAADPGHEAQPNELQQFGQVVSYCMSARCRRATVLQHFGESPPAAAAPGALDTCCDVCADAAAVQAAVRELASAGAERRQRFAGGKPTLNFGGGGGGGGGGSLEFEHSRPHEGLDFDQEGPSRALQESDDEDGIQGSSSDEEAAEAAAAARQRANRRVGGTAAVLDAMQRAEERHERQHEGGSKKARLLQKLEGGGGAGAVPAGGTSSLTPDLLQAAAHQLARVLSGNAALAAALGNQGLAAAGVAATMVQQLSAGTVSKAVFQSKLSNLAMQLKKAAAPGDVPALAAALAGPGGSAAPAATGASVAAVGAAAAPGAGGAKAGVALSVQQLQDQVQEALRLAAEASAAPDRTASGAAEGAAARALHALVAAPVTVELLQATGVARKVQQLRKHGAQGVAAAAAAVVAAWKARLTGAGAP